MNLYIFENRLEAPNLEPISLTRPTFDLRCGAFTFLERIQRVFPRVDVGVFVREELSDLVKEKFPRLEVNPHVVSDGVWLYAPVMWQKELLDEVFNLNNTVFTSEGKLVAAHLDKRNGDIWLKDGGPLNGVFSSSLPCIKVAAKVVTYLWQCVNLNSRAIMDDAAFFRLGDEVGKLDDGVRLLNASGVYVGEGSRVKTGVVLDAEEGPVILGREVTVLPGAYLQGPLVVGDGTLIKAGAHVYGGTTIGPGCKIGGEVSQSVFQSWTNKQHDGFIGHSYIGEWVNLGADTCNSDLKNNYSPVEMTVNGQTVDTGSLFVGLMMGDHVKTGINTMFNTGTGVGPVSNIAGSGFPPRTIPPFSWIVDGKREVYRLDRFVETARVVKERRQQVFSSCEEKFYRLLFRNSSERIQV